MDTVWTLRSYKRWTFLDEVCNYQLVKMEAGFGSPCKRRECVFYTPEDGQNRCPKHVELIWIYQ